MHQLRPVWYAARYENRGGVRLHMFLGTYTIARSARIKKRQSFNYSKAYDCP
jgi:hypothetical protein